MSYYTSNFHEYSGYYYNHHQPFFSNSTFDSHHTPHYDSYYPPPPPPSYPVSYDHDGHNYASCYYSQTQQPVVSYSAYHPHYASYNSIVQDPASTQFVISYSTAEGSTNDTEFEEYDPTPYDGGYDMDLAYGKPLPASDQTCYPPSSFDPNAPKADGISVNGIVAPYGGEVVGDEKHGEKEEAGSGVREEAAAVVPEQQRQEEDGFTTGDETEEEAQGEKEVSESIGIDDSAPVQDSGFDDRARNGNGNGNGGYGEKMRQIAPGYGLEATDICESLFGYWPCWARRNQSGFGNDDGGNCNEVIRDAAGYDYGIDGSYCEGTVDYLFGNPNPYGGTVDDTGNYGNPLYCYAYQRGFQQHHLYQQQHQYQQVEYGDADFEGYRSGGYYS